jgi:Ni/Co efflux regulator RcnB
MKNFLFAGFAGLSIVAATPASAQNESLIPAVPQINAMGMGGNVLGLGKYRGVAGATMGGQHRWGQRIQGRWFAGHGAPGGWGGYRQPVRGFALPTYWISPSYRIVNYPLYGLYSPNTGYGWSRYYDDAVLMDQRGYVQDYRQNIAWDRYEGGYAPGDYQQPEFGPAMGADRGVYSGDDRVSSGNGYRGAVPPQPVEYRTGTGQDRAMQAGAPYANGGFPQSGYAPPASGYQSRAGFEQYESCLRNRGIAGGAIGGIVGAVIGNRVFGRGNRLAGSLFGGGAGALLGLGIEKSVNKCKKFLPRDDRYYSGSGASGGYAPAPQPNYYPQQAPQQGGYYQNGWYYPAPVVTTITVSPAVTTTTTVTEEVYYETVAAPARKKAVRMWRPKPKPRCSCR